MKTLADRCRDFVDTAMRRNMLRVGNPVDDLAAFVVSERGRAGSPELEGSLPVVLYFRTEQDREEFLAAAIALNPGMIARPVP